MLLFSLILVKGRETFYQRKRRKREREKEERERERGESVVRVEKTVRLHCLPTRIFGRKIAIESKSNTIGIEREEEEVSKKESEGPFIDAPSIVWTESKKHLQVKREQRERERKRERQKEGGNTKHGPRIPQTWYEKGERGKK